MDENSAWAITGIASPGDFFVHEPSHLSSLISIPAMASTPCLTTLLTLILIRPGGPDGVKPRLTQRSHLITLFPSLFLDPGFV